MRHTKLPLACAAAFMLASGAPAFAEAARSEEAMIEAAKALDAAYFDAIQRRDWEAAAAMHWHDPRSIQILPQTAMPMIGWEEIHSQLPLILTGQSDDDKATITRDSTLERVRREYVVVGDTVVTWGINRWTYTDENGQRVQTLTRALNVKAEVDGKWVYIAGHSSTGGEPQPILDETTE